MTIKFPYYSDDYKNYPYWWEAAPRPTLTQADLVREVDVAVVGSGYTGLHAALQTARAGRSTLVLEADQVGIGCSSRNGGQVGTSFKPKYSSLAKRFGNDVAIRMIQEGFQALNYVKNFIRDEQLDCDWELPGRFLGIHSEKAFKAIDQQYASLPKEIAVNYRMVPKSEQHAEIETDFYHGGCVLPHQGALHPGKYQLATLQRVLDAGAMVADNCTVESIQRTASGFRLATKRGIVDAKNVILATNGYTGKQFSWFAKRIFPIGSFQIATEKLPPEIINKLLPTNRVISDTQLVLNYYRLSPDRTRVVFGGRVTFGEATSESGINELYRQMLQVFPQLQGVRVAYSWVGFVAYTMNVVPSIGNNDGIYFAMGYCGSGVSLSSYFGMRVGQKVLGTSEGNTALDPLNFKPWPSIVHNKMVLAATTNTLRFFQKLF